MTKATDVLIVIGSLQVGGAELHLAAVAPGLVKAGWRVSIYCLSGESPASERLKDHGVEIITWAFARTQLRKAGLSRIINIAIVSIHLLYTLLTRRPSIVHFFLPESYLVGGPLAVLARTPIRVMSRRSLNYYQKKHAFFGWIERRLHLFMTGILGNSRQVIKQLHDDENVPKERLWLIYNGVDVARFNNSKARELTRRKLDIKPQALVLVCVANLIAYKGHADLLNALAIVRSRLGEEWRLLVVGRDDGIGERLRQQAMLLGMGANIEFLGQRDDKDELLSIADIGINSSHEEGFSNAILEKMASGLPVIATDVGGNAEAVIDGVTGLIVPPRNPQALASALVKLGSDKALRISFGEAGRVRVTAHFAMDKCIEEYDRFYKKLIDGNGGMQASL